MKYWTKDNDSTTAVLKFYGEIGVWWNGSADFTSTLEEIEKSYTNLDIRLHCYGGQVFEGNVIYNALANTKLNIVWYIDGVAASMGGIIPLAKGKIVIAENAFWMVHVPKTYVSGASKDLFNAAKLLKNMEENAIKVFVRKTGKKDSEVRAWFDGADHWFDAQECLDMGIANEISGPVDAVGAVSKPDKGTAVETIYSRYTALATPAINSSSNNKDTMDKQLIIAHFALPNVTAASSDTAVFEALKAHYASLQSENERLKTENDKVVSATVAGMISAREKELNTTFTVEQKNNFTTIGKMNTDALQTVLQAMIPAVQLQTVVTPEGKTTLGGTADPRANWTYDEWETKDPKGLEAMAKSSDTAQVQKFRNLYVAKWGESAANDFKN